MSFFSALADYGIACMTVLRIMTVFWENKCSLGLALLLCGWLCLDPSDGFYDRILALVKIILTVDRGNIRVNTNIINKILLWMFLGYITFYSPLCPCIALSLNL